LQTISSDFFIGTATVGTSLAFKSGNGVERLRISSGGDISFYEDTGTTAKLVWDASTERLGIGNTAPTSALDVTGTVTADGLISANVSGITLIQAVGVDSNGFADVEIKSTGTSGASRLYFSDTAAQSGSIKYSHSDNSMQFATAATERMRILADGSVVQGNTVSLVASNFSNQAGAAWHKPDGHYEIATTSDVAALQIGKNNANDGTLVVFRKQGTTVGSIGTETSNSDLYIGNGDTAIMFHDGAAAIFPHNAYTNAGRDAAIDIGYSTYRFKDLYLSGGVYLGGTGAANHLDDYEEGTWTPSLGGDATYTTQVGNYTKIGNLVTIRGSVVVNVLGTGSTTVVSGLPFAENSTNNFTGSVCSYFAGIADSLSVLIASADLSTSELKFTGQGAAGTTMAVPTVFASGSRVDFAFSYEV
jgi:hypothetical protein